MKNDSNLFKEAIAEAKAVREAAIANAKAALEETITPRLKELLVTKLNEMELEEEEFVDLEEAKKAKEESEKDEAKKAEEDEKPEGDEKSEEGEESEEDESEEVDLPEDMTMDKLEDIITKIVQDQLSGEDMGGAGDMGDMSGMDGADSMSDDEISLEELLAELEQESLYEDDNEPNIDELLSELAQFRKDSEKTSNRDHQLTEALKTIKSLKQDLTEINLLNAKLLYVNKLMKEFSLSEGQVVNIMTAFDKAETTSQAKLVYETVVPTLTKKTKTTVNENRGFASKPAGIAPKKVITEGTDVISSEVVNRLQILAGIKKPI